MRQEVFDDIWMGCYETAIKHEQELFGDADTLPDDEFDIVFSGMSHGDKVEALEALRALKAQGLGVSNTAAC
ncbi:hypothetical protein SAMN05421771_1857 [Granulicella pectinivorans]|uniref:Uncharacterized protein n=1 Tax=Granulicella pectinivorans TaxID=474950 RepID=A0A1I6M5E2_9BACT|nr:hypothetical protein [Granulicella pectinivorans]SFS10853.1 hypothetical protein SAMN05421771_1857 [Granulicella pectinivorans]